MNKTIHPSVSDERLGAYLEGRLNESDNAAVEAAIEQSPELQAIVDEYLALSDSFQPTLSSSFAFNTDSSDVNDRINMAMSAVNTLRRQQRNRLVVRWSLAAILLVGVCATVFLMFQKSPDEVLVAKSNTPTENSKSDDATLVQPSDSLDPTSTSTSTSTSDRTDRTDIKLIQEKSELVTAQSATPASGAPFVLTEPEAANTVILNGEPVRFAWPTTYPHATIILSDENHHQIFSSIIDGSACEIPNHIVTGKQTIFWTVVLDDGNASITNQGKILIR